MSVGAIKLSVKLGKDGIGTCHIGDEISKSRG